MPFYQYRCRGLLRHLFERFNFVSRVDEPQNCPQCGACSDLEIVPPAIIGGESKSAAEDARIYRTHNITHETAVPGGNAAPVAPSLQCGCGNCASHRKRNSITGTAEPGKSRE